MCFLLRIDKLKVTTSFVIYEDTRIAFLLFCCFLVKPLYSLLSITVLNDCLNKKPRHVLFLHLGKCALPLPFFLCCYTNEAKPEVFYVSMLLFSGNNKNLCTKVLHLTYCAALLWQKAKSNRKKKMGGSVSHH